MTSRQATSLFAAAPRRPAFGSRAWLALRWRAVRAFSLPVSVGPVLAATAAVSPSGRWDWPMLAAACLAAALLHAAGNLLNDYFDFAYGVDRRVTDDAGRPGRLLVTGEMTPAEVLAEFAACLALAAPVCAYLLLRRPGLAWFGAVALTAMYSYTGPPLKLKYRAAGEVLCFIVFSPALMLGAAYAQSGTVEIDVLVLSVPVGLLTSSILVANNLRDADEDAQAGIRTLAHVAGGRVARGLYVGMIAAALLTLAALGLSSRGPTLLAAAPALAVFAVKPARALLAGRRQGDIDARTARFVTMVLAVTIMACVVQQARVT